MSDRYLNGLQYLTRIMIERLFTEGWETKIKTAKVPDTIIGISFLSPITLASGSMAASTPKQKQDQKTRLFCFYRLTGSTSSLTQKIGCTHVLHNKKGRRKFAIILYAGLYQKEDNTVQYTYGTVRYRAVLVYTVPR
jgi:hypothetical protein